MVRRNIVLASAIAGVLGVPSAAYAVVDFDNPKSVKVISQLSSGDVELSSGSSNSGLYDVHTTLGKSINAQTTSTSGTTTDEKFVRFDLDSDATFTGTPALTIISGLDTSASNVDVTLSGGGSGESFVIFSIKNGASTSALAADTEIELQFDDNKAITVNGADSDVKITYSIYRTALDSTKGLASALNAGGEAIDYIEFKPVFTFSTSPATLTADVENNFLQFTTGNTYAELASLSLAVDTGSDDDKIYMYNGNTAKIGGSDGVLDAEDNTITVNGDFSSLADSDGDYDVSRLFLTSDGKCSDGYDPDNDVAYTTTSLTAEKAVMDLPVVEDTKATYSLCIQRDTNSEVSYKAAEYNLDFAVTTAGNNISIADYEAQKAGKIVRNGTVLDTPFFTITTGSISRVILSNFGTTDANFTVTVQSDEGTTVTPGEVTSGTVKAGTILQINGSQLASFEGKQRGSAKFTIVAVPENMSGVYQTVNLTTGAVTSIKLVNEGGKH